MNLSGEPITKCPVCRYDLTGLPNNHACPECGFEYDESMRIWYIRGPSRGFWIIITILLPLGFFLVCLILFGTISLAKKGTFWISANALGAAISRTLLVALAGIGGTLGTQFFFRRRRPFLVVGKNTLHIQYFFWNKKLDWDDIVLAGRELTKLASAQSTLKIAPPIPKWKRLYIPECVIDWMAPFRIVVKQRNGSISEFALPPFTLNAPARKELHRAIYAAWSKSRTAFTKPEVLMP